MENLQKFIQISTGQEAEELYNLVKEWEPEDLKLLQKGTLKQLAMVNRPRNCF